MGFLSGLGKIGAAVNPTALIGTAVAGGADFLTAMYQNTANKKAATKAYERQIDLMNMQNAYNTPAEQMKRFEEAGLNPNLIYGQQNYSAGASSVAQAHSAAKPGKLDILGAMRLGQDLQLGQAQMRQVDASALASAAQAGKTLVEAEILQKILDETPAGVSPRDNSVTARALRYMKHISDSLDKKTLDLKNNHTYNPNLPALGRNYKP